MAVIKRETTVSASPNDLWAKLIDDPNQWPEWLAPLRGLDETVDGKVRSGLSFSARVGKLSAKVKVGKVLPGRELQWRGGPSMMLAMGSGMKGKLEFSQAGEGTKVNLTMVTPMMFAPMMKMMTGLNTDEEMTRTIENIKKLGDA